MLEEAEGQAKLAHQGIKADIPQYILSKLGMTKNSSAGKCIVFWELQIVLQGMVVVITFFFHDYIFRIRGGPEPSPHLSTTTTPIMLIQLGLYIKCYDYY